MKYKVDCRIRVLHGARVTFDGDEGWGYCLKISYADRCVGIFNISHKKHDEKQINRSRQIYIRK